MNREYAIKEIGNVVNHSVGIAESDKNGREKKIGESFSDCDWNLYAYATVKDTPLFHRQP